MIHTILTRQSTQTEPNIYFFKYPITTEHKETSHQRKVLLQTIDLGLCTVTIRVGCTLKYCFILKLSTGKHRHPVHSIHKTMTRPTRTKFL